MCGILGQVALDSGVVFAPNFRAALSLMKHRGPDDFGVMQGSRFIFGHQRLTIIDPDPRSKQPFLTPDKRYVLTFNGEIYNYQELRKYLEAAGVQFRTTSDTEVLLYMLIHHGEQALQQIEGMFAFAFHDTHLRTTLVARDRLGIKPLYFHEYGQRFTFASEIKAILAYTNIHPELNNTAVSSYMSFRYPIMNDSFFSNIKSLEPGTYIKICDSNITKQSYYQLADAYHSTRMPSNPISAVFQTLEKAVKLRMLADVPVGAYLSGGVDSSAIAAIMARHSQTPVKTFTIGFDEAGYNEFEYAGLVANQYGFDHQEIILSSDQYFDAMHHLIKIKDAPLSVPNEVALYLMSVELKKHITVVLSGEGADEIFAGYGRIFRSAFDYERYKGKHDLNENQKAAFFKAFAKKYGQNEFSQPIDHFLHLYRYTSLDDKKRLLSPELPLERLEQTFKRNFINHFETLNDQNYLKKMMYCFEKVHLPGLLHRLDCATMAASVEGRVPFTDQHLVALAASLSDDFKMKWRSNDARKHAQSLLGSDISEIHDIPKYALKKSLEPLLPERVLYRKKMGFPVPLDRWFGGGFKNYARDLLFSKQALSRGLYNQQGIENWLQGDKMLHSHSAAMKIWMLTNLELFMRAYF